MTRAPIKAGAVYFGLVFAVAFLLGVVRTLVIAPRLGATLAVSLEAVVLLTFSWFACGAFVKTFRVPSAPASRALMGATAFVLLMAAEFAFGALLGRPPAVQIRAFATTPGAIGLAAQIGFAMLPLLRVAVRAG